ncbi:MAG: delta-60 repeat domain-containing protein [Gammaproteobacteria bacterium]
MCPTTRHAFSGCSAAARRGPGRQDQLFGIAILPDGRIAVGGSTRGRSSDPDPPGPGIDFVAARFTDTGTLDPAFGADGLTTTDISGPNPAVDFASALVLQSDQGESKIVLVGRSGLNESSRFAAVRYLANGAPDTGFGVDGIVELAVPGGPDSRASDVAVRPTTARSYWRAW